MPRLLRLQTLIDENDEAAAGVREHGRSRSSSVLICGSCIRQYSMMWNVLSELGERSGKSARSPPSLNFSG